MYNTVHTGQGFECQLQRLGLCPECWGARGGLGAGGDRVRSGGLRGTQAVERLGAFGQGVCVASSFSGRKRAWDVSWDAGSSRGSGGAPGTCGAGGSEARGEALRVDERGRQTAGLGGRHTDPFCLRAFFVFCIFLN